MKRGMTLIASLLVFVAAALVCARLSSRPALAQSGPQMYPFTMYQAAGGVVIVNQRSGSINACFGTTILAPLGIASVTNKCVSLGTFVIDSTTSPTLTVQGNGNIITVLNVARGWVYQCSIVIANGEPVSKCAPPNVIP